MADADKRPRGRPAVADEDRLIKTSVKLSPDDAARWKASGLPLVEIVRAGLLALSL